MTDTEWNVDIDLLGGKSPWLVALELVARLMTGLFTFIIAAATIDWLGISTAVALFVAIALAAKSQFNFDVDKHGPD